MGMTMKKRKKIVRRKTKKVVLSRKHLESEVARLTQKCSERSSECYLLKVQKDALEMKLITLRQAYNRFDSEFVKAIRE
jgi:cell fate regulator YaaT (PSP1 superfamily)